MKKPFVLISLLITASVLIEAQAPTSRRQGPAGAATATARQAFPLTIDSIMRGPELVGNPPTGLRWSGDSKELYFEWLMPKDDQPSTWVTTRDAAAPRRLSEAERRMAPLANGQWDAKRR